MPILLDNLIRRKWKDALLTSIPVFILFAVMLSFIQKGLANRLVLELNTATWQVSRINFGNYWFRDFIVPIFTSARPISFFHYFHAYALAFIVLIGYFAISSYKIDWKLAVYSIAMFMLIILFGYTNGIIRYTSFIFPIWLNVKIKNILVLILILFLFYIHCLVLWHQFLWAPYPM